VKKAMLIIFLCLVLWGLIYVGTQPSFIDELDTSFESVSHYRVIYYDCNGDTVQVWETTLPPTLRGGFIGFKDAKTGKNIEVQGDLVITEK